MNQDDNNKQLNNQEEQTVETNNESTENVSEQEIIDIKDLKIDKKEVKIPDFRPGDTIKIYYKIIEGDKTRVQPYEGIVISKRGQGVSKTFTVRRIGADNVGIERIFPLSSPNITKIELKKSGKVRRAKLYYLRGKQGKAAVRIKDKK